MPAASGVPLAATITEVIGQAALQLSGKGPSPTRVVCLGHLDDPVDQGRTNTSPEQAPPATGLEEVT